MGGWGWGRSLEIPLLSVWTLMGLSLVSSSLSIVLTHVHIRGACWLHGPILTCRGRLAVSHLGSPQTSQSVVLACGLDCLL